ncbi:GH25 family lysozyme [Clostridium sp. Mt-5]|uniref:GH25 family lysozyme n=1 Tax=Clostridium moutaii TaxID=3240932 RepID=A0ABV4BS67_9CLOT
MKKRIVIFIVALAFMAGAFFIPQNVQATSIYNGVDVYEYSKISDYQQLKNSGVSVVIQKASEGMTYNDSLLSYRASMLPQYGFKVGYYHFATNNGQPVAQAQHFLNQIQGLHMDTILWLDIENQGSWSKQQAIDFTNKFIGYVQDRGYKIGIYTGLSFYYEYLSGNIGNVPIWLASYGKQPQQYSDTASWQYTDRGSISGMIGGVDMDYFNDSIFSGAVSTKEFTTLQKQTYALQYQLNNDYNAKLLCDGIAGKNTLNALQGIKPFITKGHRSHVVEWLQQKLVMYGYLKEGSYTSMVYDEPTFQAVTNLQKNWGRSTDGILGLDTWSIFLNN